MDNRDYVIAFDENGQPYISHAWGNSTAHKYIAKWGEGAKARYFYTKEELEAAMQQGKQKVKDTAEKVKDKASAAAERAKITAGKATEKAKIVGQGAAEKAKIAGQGAAERVKGAATVAENKIKDATGVTAKEKRDQAYADMVRSSRDAGRAEARAAASQANANKSEKDYEDARIRYRAAEKAVVDAQQAVIDAQADAKAKKNTRDALKKEFDSMGDEFTEKIALALSSDARDRREKVYDMFVDMGIKAADARVAAEKAMRAYDKSIKDRGSAYLNLGLAEFANHDADYDARVSARAAEREKEWAEIYKRDHNRASDKYAETPLAKVKEAADKVKSAASNAKDKAAEAIDKAKDAASNAKDKAKETVDKAKDTASKTGEQIKEAVSDMAWELSPGYRAKQRMNDAKEKYDEIADAHKAADNKRDKAYGEWARNVDKRDSSAHAQSAYDNAVSDLRENNKRNYMREMSERNEAAEKYIDARRDYSKTPLAKLEKFAKDPVGTVKDVADDAAFEVEWAVNSAVNKAKVKAAERKVDSVEKLMDDYKRPTVDAFTFDKNTGKTVKAQEMYDTYMTQAYELIGKLKANASQGQAPTKAEINTIKRLYERALGR